MAKPGILTLSVKRNLKHEDGAEVVSQRFQKHWEAGMRKEK
jgi:hypothetical protein